MEERRKLALWIVAERLLYNEGQFTLETCAALAAEVCGFSARVVQRWFSKWHASSSWEWISSQRGMHDQHRSIINDVRMKEALRVYIRQNSKKRGCPALTLATVVDWVNNQLMAEAVGTDSKLNVPRSTVAGWLHRLGFDITERKRSSFVDGHERPDVQADRKSNKPAASTRD